MLLLADRIELSFFVFSSFFFKEKQDKKTEKKKTHSIWFCFVVCFDKIVTSWAG